MVLNGISDILTAVYHFFQLRITIDEYSFTLWSVFLFSMVCVIIAKFVGGLIR